MIFSIISSPEPKAHRWAYRIGRHPSYVCPSGRQHFQTSSSLKPCVDFYQISHIASIGRGEWIIVLFCSNRIRTLVAMATYNWHWPIMEKVEIGIFCCLIADILTNIIQKCSLSSPLQFIWILSKSLNLIGSHGNIKGKFSKKYSKIFSSKAIKGMKLKLCIHVYDFAST